MRQRVRVNRTQALVLGFLVLAWLGLVAILALAPAVYDQALRQLGGQGRQADFAFLAALSSFLALLTVGVLRRWRWVFWLVVVAFLLGVLRVPAALLQLTGVLPPDGPTWYVLLQGLVGAVQLVIGLALLAGYRRSGVWGDW